MNTSKRHIRVAMDWISEAKRNKKKIIIGVLAVSIVTLILGLGLGLGLDLQRCQNQVTPLTSCRNRCYEPFDNEKPGCRCDENCVAANSCCFDYYDICTAPTEQWECTNVRCGEKRLTQSRCHCSDDCLSAGDCCTNYKHVCHGEKQWVEDTCDDLSTPTCPAGFKQPLLLVSLDGLRAEYLQTWSALIPVLDKLRRCGTSAPFMQSAFPTKTFPNHYSIVTGLYPESNGLIDNTMYDPVFDATFSLSSPEKNNPDWYLGQPIWHTAKSHGLKSGTFFWPGSDVKIADSFPDIYVPYDGTVPFEERVFTVLKWLQLPANKRLPDFFTLYLEEPDKSGHSYGPVSGGIITSLQGVDKIIGQLMNGLKQINLHRCLNIIIVADHGMEETSCERKETMKELVGDTRYQQVCPRLYCKKPDQKIKPYLKANLPKRLHFANSRRIEDVSILVDTKWLFERDPGSLTFCSGGNHGYDNDFESMHAMFISYGPKFQKEKEIEPFSNTELYNLMCDVLEVSPSSNNGTHGSMNHVLQQPYYTPVHPAEQSEPAQCPLVSLNPEDNLGCSCGEDETDINKRLNLSAEEEKKHALFGRPRMLQPDQSYCILYQEGFISAYSHKALMPLWSSFTIDKPVSPLTVTPDCFRADVRISASQSPRCDQYWYTAAGNLHSKKRHFLLLCLHCSIFSSFSGIWDYFHNTLLKKYASIYNGMNVVLGPVFDYNYDGQFDTPEQIQFLPGTNISIPTHYFIVLTSCRDSAQSVTSCDSELQTVSFLLPHRANNLESCKSTEAESQWVEDHMWFHQARVRDVEWLTGLDFYQGSNRPVPELLRVKTRPTAAIYRKQ
uniref:SMB domain-containing protein n=1 Tax=Astatotilapia calliptera TaxID=8154 RepID=A0AAX7SN59_ASTCA